MSSLKRAFLTDPIAGTIELPAWLVRIKEEQAIRRMMFIRQLGLKSYIDFPGAIHTRYSHGIGTMYLSGKVVDWLAPRMQDQGMRSIATILRENKQTLMAAGFLHDIGHGPFSHAVDYVMETISGKTHEELAEEIILQRLPPDLENWFNVQLVVKLIRGKHDYPFLSSIINGPLDVDKLDYLLRDAHHVGLKYSFDLDYFLRSYTILGHDSSPENCELGLDESLDASVTAELFLVIWKSMYDLVYHVQASRIAEKMLEKVLLMHKEDDRISSQFTKIENFLNFDDGKVFSILDEIGGRASEISNWIRSNKLYKPVLEKELHVENFQMSPELIADVKESPDAVSERLSQALNNKLDRENYQFICDIVTGRSPDEIRINEVEEGEYVLLRKKSKIVGAIQGERRLMVYVDPTVTNIPSNEDIYSHCKDLIGEL